MFRGLCLAAALAALAAPLVANAQTVIPNNVNIHNGFIEVRNHIVLKGATGDVTAKLWLTYRNLNATMEHAQVSQGGTIFLNVCCIAAGSVYAVHFFGVRLAENTAVVTPQLCNVKGIPFGYALVILTGEITYDKGWTTTVKAHVPSVSCPVLR